MNLQRPGVSSPTKVNPGGIRKDVKVQPRSSFLGVLDHFCVHFTLHAYKPSLSLTAVSPWCLLQALKPSCSLLLQKPSNLPICVPKKRPQLLRIARRRLIATSRSVLRIVCGEVGATGQPVLPVVAVAPWFRKLTENIQNSEFSSAGLFP